MHVSPCIHLQHCADSWSSPLFCSNQACQAGQHDRRLARPTVAIVCAGGPACGLILIGPASLVSLNKKILRWGAPLLSKPLVELERACTCASPEQRTPERKPIRPCWNLQGHQQVQTQQDVGAIAKGRGGWHAMQRHSTAPKQVTQAEQNAACCCGPAQEQAAGRLGEFSAPWKAGRRRWMQSASTWAD